MIQLSEKIGEKRKAKMASSGDHFTEQPEESQKEQSRPTIQLKTFLFVMVVGSVPLLLITRFNFSTVKSRVSALKFKDQRTQSDQKRRPAKASEKAKQATRSRSQAKRRSFGNQPKRYDPNLRDDRIGRDNPRRRRRMMPKVNLQAVKREQLRNAKRHNEEQGIYPEDEKMREEINGDEDQIFPPADTAEATNSDDISDSYEDNRNERELASEVDEIMEEELTSEDKEYLAEELDFEEGDETL